MYPPLASFRPTVGLKAAFLVLASGLALEAQIGLPGQYPGGYPPGRYPGQYPPGQGPGGRSGGNSAPQQGRTRRNADQAPVARTYSGLIRKLDEKGFELELEDTRFLLIEVPDTATKPNGLKAGDGADVDATEDRDGKFHAVSIKLNASIARVIEENDQIAPIGPTGQQAEERTGPPPTIMARPGQDSDDADAPPKLKRGIPERVSASTRDDDVRGAHEIQPAPPPQARPASNNPRQAFVEKARDVAATFLDNLPNYVCQEVTTRYASETKVPNWSVIDVLTADVVYESGKESYKNLTLNGKPLHKPPEESGAWSTGEFGTILGEVFSPYTNASFRFAQDDTIAHKPSSVYDFSVERLRSAWRIAVPGQYVMPAYKGSVWVDKESAHTLRIEMQAKNIPDEFPRIAVETAVDYDYVSLGAPEKFLLPVRAEILSCSRGSNECDRNVIEFRNYHKFTGESIIKFDSQQ